MTENPVEPTLIHPQDCEMEGWEDPNRGSVKWWTLLSADRTPTRGITCGIVEISLEEPLIAHKHSQDEVYHILSGQGVVTIEGKAYSIKRGDTLFIAGNLYHSTDNTEEEPLRIFYVFPTDSFADVQYEF